MNNPININVRVFHVSLRDERTGAVSEDTVVLTKGQLRAAQTVGQSSKELICRIFNREGYRVMDIGKAIKRTISVDLYATAVDGEIVIEGDARLGEGDALERFIRRKTR